MRGLRSRDVDGFRGELVLLAPETQQRFEQRVMALEVVVEPAACRRSGLLFEPRTAHGDAVVANQLDGHHGVVAFRADGDEGEMTAA